MPRSAVSRTARAGCSAGNARSWASTSGDALQSTQSAPSPESAIDDWVRGLARRVPLRTPSQLRQLQFHCGKPPPAAAPRTWIRMKKRRPLAGPPLHRRPRLTAGDVHRHLEAETHLGVLRFSPHVKPPALALCEERDRPAYGEIRNPA